MGRQLVELGLTHDDLGTASRDDRRELVVVEHDVDRLTVDHVGQLGRGEPGVEEHQVGTELGAGGEPEHEPPVVAGEDPDDRPGTHTAPAQPEGDGVARRPELAVRHGAAVVDEGGGPWVARRPRGQRAGQRGAPRCGGEHRPRQTVGPLRQEAGARRGEGPDEEVPAWPSPLAHTPILTASTDLRQLEDDGDVDSELLRARLDCDLGGCVGSRELGLSHEDLVGDGGLDDP
jgi:hypothetical protein